MTSAETKGDHDALAEGISRGLGLAAPAAPQVELLAEFVTIALAAGVTSNHVDGWISDLCEKGAA
jgi:hypothetical protein